MKKVLSIAGSDCSGGAGIQGDLKTMTSQGVYAMSVITSITAQNTLGIIEQFNIPNTTVANQIVSIYEDIPPDSVKIGMIGTSSNIDTIEYYLKKYNQDNVVLDTVLKATTGKEFADENMMAQMIEKLFPIADVITPNILEAEKILNISIFSYEDMKKALIDLGRLTKGAVLLKGGHIDWDDYAVDMLKVGDEIIQFKEKIIDNKNTHGSGCVLSSAIASNLAKGMNIEESVYLGKKYITKLIKKKIDIGKGQGPLCHT